MPAKEKDFYQTLGVAQSATPDEIKKAFKKLAREHHPDAGGDEAKMKEISEAYETLSDAEKREQYDTYLKYGAFAAAGGQGGYSPWAGGGGQGGWRTVTDYGDMGSWSEIFSRMAHGEGAFGTDWQFPGRKTKGADVQVTLEVSFEEAFSGTKKRITVRKGDGSNIQLDVKVPAGAVDGGKLRYKGKGNEGAGGGAPGDMVVVTAIKEHELYTRSGANVVMSLPLAIDEAALGASITIPAPDGSKVRMKVPPGTQEGKLFLIKGKGAPKVKGGGNGDLHIQASIVVPEQLSEQEQEALQAFAQARAESGTIIRRFANEE